LRGTTIVQIENERITRWSDYYDQVASRRLAAFSPWIEYYDGQW
jgi:hypothetical protein